MSQAGTFFQTGGIPAFTLTGNVGGTVPADGLGNINVVGTGPINVVGTPVTNTLTIAIVNPLTVDYGGTGRSALTDHGLLLGAGLGSQITVLAEASDGQLPIGSTGNDPVLATLTAGNNIGITNAAGSITVDVNGTTQYAVQVGDATGSLDSLAVGTTDTVLLGSTGANPVWGTVPNAALTNSSITMTDGNNITITGSPVSLGGAATINVSGTTQYAVQVGDATGSLDSLAIGTANQVLQSGGAGANPAWSTATYPATTAQGDILYSGTANAISGLTKDATATRYIANTGASNNPAWDQINLTNGVTGILPVPNGGTGANTLTDHGVLLGSGVGAITALTVGTDGQVLLGSSAADPVFATLTSSGSTIAFTPGAGSLNLETGSTVATSFPTDSGTGTPAAGALTISGTGAISTSGAGSTVTIASEALTWVDVRSPSQSMAVNTGYTTNDASTITYTLPASAVPGQRTAVVGNSANGWTIVQNAGQTIHFLSQDTTTGVGGSLSSTNRYDCVELICTFLNTEFVVRHAVGNLTVV